MGQDPCFQHHCAPHHSSTVGHLFGPPRHLLDEVEADVRGAAAHSHATMYWRAAINRRAGPKPRRLRFFLNRARGFVMTNELMLFLALALGFTVVLVEWWARRTP
jgi:hypothetical protein